MTPVLCTRKDEKKAVICRCDFSWFFRGVMSSEGGKDSEDPDLDSLCAMFRARVHNWLKVLHCSSQPRVSFTFLEPASPKKVLSSSPDHLPTRLLPVHLPTSHTPPGRKPPGAITISLQPHLSNTVSMDSLTSPLKLLTFVKCFDQQNLDSHKIFLHFSVYQ
ncbi:hypothetical protein ILYODFUR_024537 [Ilyodon furcidens]|uniref:Uncharacterized protein n=1 Tax=Ilyodon furcidens TaxID=33524 RepID=A0ABV0U856_9TELE